MPESVKLVKAELRQIGRGLRKPKSTPSIKSRCSLIPKRSKSVLPTQIQTPEGAGDQRGSPAQQFVGAGSTKLSLQLWFDVNAPQEGEAVHDVRKMTEKISFSLRRNPTRKMRKNLFRPACDLFGVHFNSTV